MNIVTILSIIVIIFAIVAKQLSKKNKVSTKLNHFPYHKVTGVMDKYELELFHNLQQLLENNYLIFAKPRMEDFVQVNSGMDYKQRSKYRGYIKSRHVDFLICHKDTSEPLLAIELDGSSHKSQKVKKRDEMINNIYSAARLSLVHIPISKRSDTDYLRENILTLLDKK